MTFGIGVGMKETMTNKHYMSKKTIIKKGTHGPIKIPKVKINPILLQYEITFTDSCKYDIGQDQSDINKLFGIGYLPFHHYNSVRIGWNYNIKINKIDIWAYWYKKGVRGWEWLDCVNFMQPSYMEIQIKNTEHIIRTKNSYFSVPVNGESIGYLLRPYFGGNQKAPHDIKIIGI